MSSRNGLKKPLWLISAVVLACIQVAAAMPDLFVSELSMSPETPSQGSEVSVRIGVYNQGNSPSGPFTVKWWPGENYPQPACSWHVDGLVPNGGRILTCTYEGYPSWYAQINTKAVVDSSNQVAEGDESNNVRLKAIRVSNDPSNGPSNGYEPQKAPDLLVSEFSLSPSIPGQGEPVQVRVGVYNKGNKASGPFTVKWWPGENYPQPACSWQVDGLVPNGGRILTCTYEGYPSWYGSLNTKVVADFSGQVEESDESNNVGMKTISVSKPSIPSPAPAPQLASKADLFVSEFSMSPSPPVQGVPVQIRVGVYNKGNKASGPFTVHWWPGENYPQPACSWQVDGLVPNGGRILTCTYEGYPSWYAQLVTKAVVDSLSQVGESDEGNNIYKKTINVLKP